MPISGGFQCHTFDDTLGAFGLSVKNPVQLAKNLTRVNDVLAKTTTSANTNMESLFETIVEGGAVAKGAGASIETYAALAGKLANAGIKGSSAGTTLKNVFLSLAGQTPKASKALEDAMQNDEDPSVRETARNALHFVRNISDRKALSEKIPITDLNEIPKKKAEEKGDEVDPKDRPDFWD